MIRKSDPWKVAFDAELADIDRRVIDGTAPTKQHLVGLAFSGGGIRSATFGLGVLETLKELDRLKQVHYLSTVSGGGYIGAWLSANCKRNRGWLEQSADWLGSIRHLRRHSNYLSPKVGFFSADTWSMFTIWIRNTLLIQLMVILAIAAVLLPPRPLLEIFQGWPAAGGWRWLTIGFFLIAVVGIAGNHLRLTRKDSPWVLHGERWLAGLLSATACMAAAYGVIRWFDFDPFAGGPIDPRPAILVAGLLVLSAFCFQPVGVKLVGFFLKKTDRPTQINYTQGWVQVAVVMPLMITGILVAAVLWGESRVGDLSSLHTFGALLRTSQKFWPFPLAVVFVSLWLLSLCGMRRWTGDVPPSRWERVKPWLTAFLAPIPSVFILHMLLCAIMLLLHSWAGAPGDGALKAFVAAPALVLYAFSLAINLLNGMMGRESTEDVREWWSRLGAWTVIYGLAWTAVALAAVYGPVIAEKIVQSRPWTFGGGWIGTTIAGLLAGNSQRTDGQGKRLKRNKLLELIAMVAPFVFIAGLVIAISAAIDRIAWINAGQGWASIGEFHLRPSKFVIVSLVMWLICLGSLLLLAARVDINLFSLSAFYRNRLVRCYLGATRSPADRNPQNFTGFDEHDDLKLVELNAVDQKQERIEGPFHVVNCALNLGGSSDLALHTRHSAAFTMTPSGCGSAYLSRERDGTSEEVGYVPIKEYGLEAEAPTLGQAIAISGAAASPNMGYHTSPVVAFLLTVFNVRLGWWFPNPMRKRGTFSSPHYALTYLFAELFGGADDKSRFLNLSDGGHFENLAAYELVRRKCRVIVISDGECDLDLNFEGLGRLIRMCDVDHGARIDIDVRRIHVQEGATWSRRQFAVGTIDYGSDHPRGILIYLKASMTDDEDTAVMQYKASHGAFPHESTGNQFYKEDQFESYRRLGRLVAERAFEAGADAGTFLDCALRLLRRHAPELADTI
jgi:hypothetical protein